MSEIALIYLGNWSSQMIVLWCTLFKGMLKGTVIKQSSQDTQYGDTIIIYPAFFYSHIKFPLQFWLYIL